jgi:hypothetical protein
LGKKIAYVKDEGSNLNARTTTLKSIMKCEVISLNEISNAFILAMIFLRDISMLQLMKRFIEILDIFSSSQNCKYV